MERFYLDLAGHGPGSSRLVRPDSRYSTNPAHSCAARSIAANLVPIGRSRAGGVLFVVR